MRGLKKEKPSARDKFGKDQRLTQAAWDERYRTREMGWDMGRAAPPLARISEFINVAGKRVLVPGCGRGFEALLFAQLGAADVLAVDFSTRALDQARKLSQSVLGPRANVITWAQADVRAVPAAWKERFDLVVEHCCFCAIAPSDRRRYLAEIHRVLKPSGRLLGLFFVDFENPDGPPFGIFQYRLRPMLEQFFQPIYWEAHPPDSIKHRRDQDALVIAQRGGLDVF